MSESGRALGHKPAETRKTEGAESLCASSFVTAKTSPNGEIRVVATEEYEQTKGPGIAAPWPGHDAIYIPAWGEDARLYWRPDDESEWREVERPADGETFDCRPGESIRIEAPPALGMEMW